MTDPSEGRERARAIEAAQRITLRYVTSKLEEKAEDAIRQIIENEISHAWQAGRRSLEQERDELRTELLNRGQHAIFCTIYIRVGDDPFVCNCGWDDLKARLAPPVPKGDS